MIELPEVDTIGLLREAEARFVLDARSFHGPAHWRSVLVNWMKLGKTLNGDRPLIAVFALLHDCRRENEWRDPARAVQWQWEEACHCTCDVNPHEAAKGKVALRPEDVIRCEICWINPSTPGTDTPALRSHRNLCGIKRCRPIDLVYPVPEQ